MIGVLQQEGDNPLGLLSVLTRDLNLILELRGAASQGENPGAFLKKRGVFQPQRARVIEQASRRLSRPQLHQAIEICSQIDRAAKGFDSLTPWHYLRDLSLLLSARS